MGWRDKAEASLERQAHQAGVGEAARYEESPHYFTRLRNTLKERWEANPERHQGIQNKLLLGALEGFIPPRQYAMGEGGKYEQNPEFMEHLAMGTLSSGSNAIKAGTSKVKQFPQRMINKKGGASREVVPVNMVDESGREFVQPFYKSSGTSSVDPGLLAKGIRAERADQWAPFMGRTESKGSRFYRDKSGGANSPVGGARGWYIKGEKHSAAPKDFTLTANKRAGSDLQSRMGAYDDVSKEISRLEDMGYYEGVGEGIASSPEIMNEWIRRAGSERPRSFGIR